MKENKEKKDLKAFYRKVASNSLPILEAAEQELIEMGFRKPTKPIHSKKQSK